MKKIRVLLCDDSNVILEILKQMFESAPDFEIVGMAKNGEEAIELTRQLSPDVITMDIYMPGVDGFKATKMIMSLKPTPIVVISSAIDEKEVKSSFRILQEGALAVLTKPRLENKEEWDAQEKRIVDTVRAMSEIHVITRRYLRKTLIPAKQFHQTLQANRYELLALGASTGGPQALQYLLAQIPKNFPLPIVIVQHIAEGFTEGFASWLHYSSNLPVHVAKEGEYLQSANVYIAPDRSHTKVCRVGDRLHITLDKSPPLEHFRPAINVLFQSIAEVCPGTAVAGLLTGMGRDGAQGLLSMRKNKCLTFAQDEESCVVFGMPKAAFEIEAVKSLVKLDEMPTFILDALGSSLNRV